jgi:HEAT repeat protein
VAAARRYAGRLSDELEASQRGEEKAALLRALGNAGLDSNIDVARKYAGDPDAEVREAAARSLRKVDTPEATTSLLGALGDDSAAVQAGALEGLQRRTLDDATLAQVAEAARAPGFARRLDGALLNLSQRYLPAAAATEMVRTVLARPDADPALRARARLLLGMNAG